MRIKSPCHILLFALLLISSCHHADINDPSKRNENWVWWVDKATGVGKWIPVANQTTVKDGAFSRFYSNGKIYSSGKLKNSKEIDTTFFYDYTGAIQDYVINGNDSTYYYPINCPHKIYYQTGEISQEGIVENHKRGDQWIWYYKNGTVSGKKSLTYNTGWRIDYYESGNIQDSAHYTNGIQDGLTFLWFENGQLEQVTNWKMHKKDGVSFNYYENGNLDAKMVWKDGQNNGVDSEWYENRQLKCVVNYKNDKKDGECKAYYENGNRKLEYYYTDDIPDGPVLFYYPTGQLRQSGICKNGIRKGEGKDYYPDGQISKISNFESKDLPGKVTVYYHNGHIGAEVPVINERMTGEWKYYDSTGKQVKTFPAALSNQLKSVTPIANN